MKKKGQDMTGITEKKVKQIEKWINNYPRKLFNGKDLNEIYEIQLK